MTHSDSGIPAELDPLVYWVESFISPRFAFKLGSPPLAFWPANWWESPAFVYRLQILFDLYEKLPDTPDALFAFYQKVDYALNQLTGPRGPMAGLVTGKEAGDAQFAPNLRTSHQPSISTNELFTPKSQRIEGQTNG
jgi:hypothetical protein